MLSLTLLKDLFVSEKWFNLITDSKSNYPCNKSLTTVIKLALNEMNDSH